MLLTTIIVQLTYLFKTQTLSEAAESNNIYNSYFNLNFNFAQDKFTMHANVHHMQRISSRIWIIIVYSNNACSSAVTGLTKIY